MALKIANLARSKLAVPVSKDETQLQVLTGHGARFPVLSSGDWFPVVLENEDGKIEICRATARTGDVITVLRGREGTDSRAYLAGDACELRMTVDAYNALGGGGSSTGPVISVSNAVIVEA